MRVSGKTKFWNSDRSYGFIVPDAGGPDVFVHIKDLKVNGIRELKENQSVTFEVIAGRDGKPKASDIRLG